MAIYYKGVQFVTADDLVFMTADDKNFYVRDNSEDYFGDTTNNQLNLNTISFGSYLFAGNQIEALKLHHESGLLTDQLVIDTLTARVKSDTRPVLTRYTPITVQRGESIMGVFFNGQIKEVGYKTYSIYAESYISLLDYDDHPGGIYIGADCGDVIAEIMGDIPYTIHPNVASLKLYGYLPYTTKRKNLQQILIATGAAIRKNANGTMHFTVLTNAVTGTFMDSRSFIDGAQDEDTQVTAVQVTEHTLAPVADEITLLESSFTDTQTVTFTEPAHDLTIVNGTILESSANYAVIQGAGTVTLKGKKYRHTTKIMTRGDILGTPDDKIISVTDATLITALNSSQVAQRLYNYAKCNKSVQTDVLVNGERTGDMVQLVNPYGDDYLSAAIHSLDLSMSNVMRASGEFLVDYEPQGISEGYKNRVVLTGSGSFTVPAEEYRVVLIGGGQGGQGGYDGEDGNDGAIIMWPPDRADGGDGGAGGDGGSGGKILDVTLTGTIGSTITYSCGTGGYGGGSDGGTGNEGAATTFGVYSSSTGIVGEYVDAMTAERFAAVGESGIDGGQGGGFLAIAPGVSLGKGADVTYDETTYIGGTKGANDSVSGPVYAMGGAGGGAAVGDNGSNGGNGSADSSGGIGGHGGAGGDADPGADATDYGYGGQGGHGGGGGGGAGNVYGGDDPWPTGGGSGGSGGLGGKGGPGCIIVYY